MKILFVIKTIDYGDHISIAYLSSIAKELGNKTFLCILDNDNIFDKIEYIKPKILAYSANILSYNEMVKINKEIIKKHNFISIMGGPHPTFNPDLFEDSNMDAFCIGEGELPFKEFLQNIEKNKSFDNVKNLLTKNRHNEVRPLIDNLDSIPMPDRDITIENSFLKNISKKSFFTSRGCFFSCSYCHNNYYKKLYKGKGKIIRRFSVDYVINEMEKIKNKYTMDFVKIGDDLFAYKVDSWLEEFVDKYSRKIDLPFNCYLRLDLINKDLLIFLKKAGCYSVHLSIDSCSKFVREEVLNRKWKNIDIEKKIKMIHNYGIKTWVNFMLAAPESTLQDDLDAIILGRKTKINYISFTTTIPMPNTQLFNYCVENNFIDSNFNLSDNPFTSKTVLNKFSKKEKSIRYNILCLGAIAAKMPFPLYNIFIFVIKNIPSNRLFKKIYNYYLNYIYKNVIFKLKY